VFDSTIPMYFHDKSRRGCRFVWLGKWVVSTLSKKSIVTQPSQESSSVLINSSFSIDSSSFSTGSAGVDCRWARAFVVGVLGVDEFLAVPDFCFEEDLLYNGQSLQIVQQHSPYGGWDDSWPTPMTQMIDVFYVTIIMTRVTRAFVNNDSKQLVLGFSYGILNEIGNRSTPSMNESRLHHRIRADRCRKEIRSVSFSSID
jgi:hypothetical protein